jgi:hypothetical protein
MKTNLVPIYLLAAALLALPAVVQAQFTYTTTNGTITITGYTGPGGVVNIPAQINGLPVTSIGFDAFADTALTSVTIPDSVTTIGAAAFADDLFLATVYIGSGVTTIGATAFIDSGQPHGSGLGIYYFFKGNAPVLGGEALGYFPTTIYYLPGATGWDFFGYTQAYGRVVGAVLWNPQIQTNDAGFGVRNNQFGFNINWAGGSGQSVVVEACTNLINPVWVPVGSVTFTNDSSYFSDPDWTNCPSRFYRLKNADPPPFVGFP